ncbi:MAG: methylamine utilization protein MauJ [Candidatus Eisenbacteria bacterium]
MDKKPEQKPITFSIPIDKLGPPGHEGNLILSFANESDDRTERERMTDSTEREFDVMCVLNRRPDSSRSLQAGIAPSDGDSFLLVPDAVESVFLDTTAGRVTLSKNERGELAGARMKCAATSHSRALDTLNQALAPWLDYYSFKANVPVVIGTLHSIDVKNRTASTSFVSPHKSVVVPEGVGEMSPEIQPIYALYREAKNTSSNFYKFLCYHRILEGIYGGGKLRANLMRSARRAGVNIVWPADRVPPTLGTDGLPADFVGRAISDVFNRELTSEYRRNVAHFRAKDGTILNPSSYSWNSKFAQVVRVSEACARTAMESYEKALEELERGTIRDDAG